MSATPQIIGGEDLREVRLYGHLGKRFGRVHRVAVKTCHEAMQALGATLVGFKQYILAHNLPGYHVFIGRINRDTNIGADLLDAPLQADQAVCVVPAVAGAKRGAITTIVGVVLMVVGAVMNVYTPGSGMYLMQIGELMFWGGVIQMLTPIRKGGDQVNPNNLPSYHYDGPVNATQQGLPVPLVYGRMIVGSSVVSQGISSSELAI